MTEVNFERTALSAGAKKLIATFLRFEFALKASGYCPKEGDASVEWDRVANELGSAFYIDISQSGKAETIMKRPPKKQIAHDHRLEWMPQALPTNVRELFEAVRRVRNNLVHGGKSGDPEYDPNELDRNEKLISEAQWIVEQALCRLDNVRHYFEGRY